MCLPHLGLLGIHYFAQVVTTHKWCYFSTNGQNSWIVGQANVSTISWNIPRSCIHKPHERSPLIYDIIFVGALIKPIPSHKPQCRKQLWQHTFFHKMNSKIYIGFHLNHPSFHSSNFFLNRGKQLLCLFWPHYLEAKKVFAGPLMYCKAKIRVELHSLLRNLILRLF